MSNEIILAFAGSGSVTQANVRELLNDYLGFGEEDEDGWPAPSDRDITLVLPASKNHVNDNLGRILDWSEYVDLPYTVVSDGSLDGSSFIEYAEQVKEVPKEGFNLNLLSQLFLHDNAYLILLWGEEGDDNCHELLDLANENGIKVLDLTAGLDELVFADVELAADEVETPNETPTTSNNSEQIEIPLEEEEKPLIEEETIAKIETVNSDVDESNSYVDIKRARQARERAEAQKADEAQAMILSGGSIGDKDPLDDIKDALALLTKRVEELEAKQTKTRGRPRTKDA